MPERVELRQRSPPEEIIMSMCSSAVRHPGRAARRRPLAWGWLCWLVAALWGLASASAAAEPPSRVRYDRKPGTVRPKGDLKAALEQAREAAAKEPRGPTSTARPPTRKRQDITLAALDDQIRVMQALLREAERDDKDYPAYLFRFADLHLDRKAIFEDEAGALYEDVHALQQAGKKEAARTKQARQRKLLAQARKASEAATKAYAALVDEPRWAGWDRMDEALYYYAFELGQLGRESAMQAAYVRLLRDHPTSRFVPQVYVSFGDQMFASGDVAKARALYDKVIDGHPDSPVYAYALYKSAWCHLNPAGTAEPDYARSLQRFVDTIAATLEGRAGSEANGRQLRRDARRDLVAAYVHAGRPSKAWEFFSKVGRGPTKEEDMTREMMVRLASTYFGEGMVVESTATYHRLRDELPQDDDRCEWQYRVVLNALAIDDAEIQWKETERLGQEWERLRGTKRPKPVLTRCHRQTRDTLQRMATVWHDEGDKTGRLETFALADRAYAAYLSLFGEERGAYDMQYWHGELSWQQAERLYGSRDPAQHEQGRAKFKAAHDAFVRALELEPKGAHSGEAAYAQMLSLKNYLEYDETAGKRRGCRPQPDGTCVYPTERRRARAGERVDASQRFVVTDYTPDEQAMLDAYARFERYAGAGAQAHPEEAPKILFHRALLMVEHNRFDEARPVLERLLRDHDGTVFAVWGGEMLLDSLTIPWADASNTTAQTLKASDALERWARKVQDMKLYGHAEASRLREAVPELLASVGRRKAELHHAAGVAGEDPEGYRKCAQQYLAVYEEFEDYPRGDELLFDAARCFEADFRVGHAIKAREALLERHPDSTLAKQTLREVGENYHAIAFYDDAAERYEQFAARYGKDEFAGDALENAFLFRLGLGQQPEAARDLERYEALYRRDDPKRAAGIFWAKHELIDDPDEQLRHAEAYVRTYGRKGGLDRLAVAYATAGQIEWRRSCPKALLGDACVSLRRERATVGTTTSDHAADLRRRNRRTIPERCGRATQGVITVHRRDAKLAAAAQEHFSQAIALAAKATVPEGDPERAAAFGDALGKAMVYQADAAYEDYLRIEMPEDLDFFVEEWKKETGHPALVRQYEQQLARVERSKARFSAFFSAKVAKRDALVAAYGKVAQSKSPHWVLAAAARSAVVYQNFADQLYRAEVPKAIRTEEAYDDYCLGLADHAQPLEDAATAALSYCLERSTEFQYFNEFSRMCEEELQQRSPDRFPATHELFGHSEYTRARMDAAGVQGHLERAGQAEAPGRKVEEPGPSGKEQGASL
ncbi:MAG: hypothetical protein KDK70_11120 [Myxococcales bacterium]|nr:hypothetical protein [Myxococcales bacterium]